MAEQIVDKPEIVVVWFKRDLRFTDHEALYQAQKQALPILLLYCFEPSVMAYHDSDVRHWRFVHQSLREMNEKLQELEAQLYLFHSEVLPVFTALQKQYHIRTIFSHQEVGNKLTFDRDKAVQSFCSEQNITWNEYRHNAVQRGGGARLDWEKRWKSIMTQQPFLVSETDWNLLTLSPETHHELKGPV
jgi:deoxyribodipyrimidine photo-lyase